MRDDLAVDDFYLLVSNAPVDQPPAVLDRWVDLILFGISGEGRGPAGRGRRPIRVAD